MGVDDWVKGENRDSIKKEITTLENVYTASEVQFENKGEENKNRSQNISPQKSGIINFDGKVNFLVNI